MKNLFVVFILLLCSIFTACSSNDSKYLGITPEEFMYSYNDILDSFDQNYEQYKITSFEKVDTDGIGSFIFSSNYITGNYSLENDSQNARQIGFLVTILNEDMKLNIFNALAVAATSKTNVQNVKGIVADLIAKQADADTISNGFYFGILVNKYGKPVDLHICDQDFVKSSE